jgi:hypothetical protein
MNINGYNYELNSYGMMRQLNPKKFDYSKKYLDKQSTNENMSWLRIGYLSNVISYECLRDSKVIELGPGTGMFFDILQPYVRTIDGYDIVESKYSTVTLEDVRSTKWDLLCAFDVLEHFEEIDDLWKIDFKWGYFSMPCPPTSGITATWKHLKPNEHIWHIKPTSFKFWAEDHGYSVVASGSPEDLIRNRWDEKERNINSFIIKRL